MKKTNNASQSQTTNKNSNDTKRLIALISLMLLLVGLAFGLFYKARQKPTVPLNPPVIEEVTSEQEPSLAATTVVEGLSHPWDIIFLPGGEMVFSQRSGSLEIVKNGQVSKLTDLDGVYVRGEGGLTGLAVDKDFSNNNYIYACFNSQNSSGVDVRVARLTMGEDLRGVTNRTDIITGIPSNNSGRHSGCQLETDKAGHIWVGTGDAAQAENPQSTTSLGGKILRVDRDGRAVEDNIQPPFDGRIFNYGHRNTQGLVIFDEPKDGVYGYSTEHGSNIEDELNQVKSGNFGWDPLPPYNEGGVPMTDKTKFPDAHDATWNSGSATIAISGLSQLNGQQWGAWEGHSMMGVLKGKHLRLLKIEGGKVTDERELFKDRFGRIRAVVSGPDGNIYISTDNGTNDKIIKITASLSN